MRIGIDARCLEWQRGGVARVLTACLEHWPHMTDRHQYVLLFQNHIPEDFKSLNGPYEMKVLPGPNFLKSRRVFAEQLVMPWVIPKERFDLFFAPWYTAPLFTSYKKLVVAAWDISYSTNPEHYSLAHRFSLGYFSRKACLRADGVLTCSDYDAEQIQKYYRIQEANVRTLYLSADEKFTPTEDPSTKEAMTKKLRIPEKYILSMGVIYNRRNIDVLIEAFERIQAEFPEVGLVVVGRNATAPPIDLQKKMAGLVKSGRGVYMEWAPEECLVDLYRFAQFYFCTSTVDGESIMLKEAMQCGTPVITSQLLERTVGKIGFVTADPSDTCSVAAVLRKALSADPKTVEVLSQQGIEWNKQYSWKKVAKDALEFIESR